MKMWTLLLATIFIIHCLLTGCTSNQETKPTTIGSEIIFPNTVTIEPTSVATLDPLADFSSIIPDADVYDSLSYDLDNNGEDDYIILYSVDNDSESISAGLSVCLSKSLYSAINLDSNNELTFASGITLTKNSDTPVISVDLKDPASGTIYTYVIEYTIDSTKREVNYAISSTIKIE